MKRKLFLFFILIGQLGFSKSMAQSQDENLSIVAKGQLDTTYFKALYNLGIDFERKDSNQAMAYFKQNIEDANPQNLTQWTAFAMIRLAGVYSSIGKIDSAMLYFEKAGGYLAQHPENLRVRHMYFTGLGIHNNRNGNYYEAIENYQEVAKVDISVLTLQNLAGNHLNISNVYRNLGMVAEQTDNIFKALTIFEEIQQLMGISYCYNALANLYYTQKEYVKAEEYFLKSYEMRIQQEDKRGEAVVLGSLALVMKDTYRFQEALNYLFQAREIHQHFEFKDQVASANFNLGKTFLQMGQLDSALSYLQEAYSLQRMVNNYRFTSQILAELGQVYSLKKNSVLAEKFLIDAVEQATLSQNADSRKNAYLYLSNLYENNGSFQKALEFKKNYHDLSDSLDNVDLKIKTQQLEARYVFDKKEAEINLLKAEKELATLELDRQYSRQLAILIILIMSVLIAFLVVNRYRILNRAKRQMEMERIRGNIAQDLHDDIGSTLSSIQIMSKVAQHHEHGPVISSLRKIENQATLMMDKLGDIVWSLKSGEDSMEEMVAKMKEFAAELLEPLNIEIAFEGMELLLAQSMDLEKRKNLYLIFKEALNNAAKYSQCTQIRVSFSPNGQIGTFHLKIVDNGKGFDTKQTSRGNGLSHIKQRAEKIKGKLEIRSEEMKGTQVVLELASHH